MRLGACPGFDIRKYFANEKRFNNVFSRNILPKTLKNGVYIVNLMSK